MKSVVKFLTGMTFITLAACSTQQVQQNTTNQSHPIETDSSTEDAWPNSGLNPPLKIIIGDKTLMLVRIMDGGVCKNELQGAKGEFLIYADPDDIERIKREKNSEIFEEFENKIQVFSTQVFQEAIEATNLAENPFSLGEDESREKMASQLVNNFRSAVIPAVNAFKDETTLTIDVTPFLPSFVFYQKGCDMAEINPES